MVAAWTRILLPCSPFETVTPRARGVGVEPADGLSVQVGRKDRAVPDLGAADAVAGNWAASAVTAVTAAVTMPAAINVVRIDDLLVRAAGQPQGSPSL
jgi:hypothetical protein